MWPGSEKTTRTNTLGMEKVPRKDIDRMMAFINHEADEKIKEMKIKAIQEYNAEKARIIKEETMKEENEFMIR